MITRRTHLNGFVTACIFFALGSMSGCSQQQSTGSSVASSDHKTQKDETVTTNVKSPEGAWAAKEAVVAGTAFPRVVTKSITLLIAGQRYEVNVGGILDKGECTVDVSSSPGRMKIVGEEGPNTGKTCLAIFEFPDPTTLRVSYDMTGTEYPSTFESTVDNGLFVGLYSRTD